MSRRDDLLPVHEPLDDVAERSRQKKRPLFIILSVVGSVVLILALGCAGVIYYAIQTLSDLSKLTPEADVFLNDLKSGQVDSAYARTTKGFQARQSLQQFQAFVNRWPILTTQTSREYTGAHVFIRTNGKSGTLHVTVRDSNSSLSLMLFFSEEDGQWKVKGTDPF